MLLYFDFHPLSDVCTLVKSCNQSATCIENDDKTVKCVCPAKENCPSSSRMICASNNKTYDSECLMKIEACKMKLSLKKIHDGPCGT